MNAAAATAMAATRIKLERPELPLIDGDCGLRSGNYDSDAVRIANVERRQAEFGRLAGDLAQDLARSGFVRHESWNAARRHLVAISKLDRVQLDFGELVAVEPDFRDDT